MTLQLTDAVRLAESLRFSKDRKAHSVPRDPSAARRARNLFAQHDLEINAAITPALYGHLMAAFQALRIPDTAVQAFVYAGPTLQAECHTSGDVECLIRFSSALVDLLDDVEMRFVAGHEVGHFLLGHQATAPASSVEYYMRIRYQEISADRVGLVACGSLDHAVRALMKTSSGLSDRHLRFDVSAFLAQLRHVDDATHVSQVGATHPSLVVRAKALLWFSMTRSYNQESNADSAKAALEDIDRRIEQDLDRYVDASVSTLIEEARRELLLWSVAEFVLTEGSFRKNDQRAAEELLDRGTVDGLRRFLGGLDSVTARTEVNARREQA